MNNNTKRKDVADIRAIIDELDKEGQLITSKAIGERLGQSGANVHRILVMFGIDLKPYQDKYRAEERVRKAKESIDIATRLRAIDTSQHTLNELVALTGFNGTDKQLKRLLIAQKLPYKTKSWFAQHLKKVQTDDKTLRELYNECGLESQGIAFATFRTRLYENAIPYRQLIKRKNWWQDLEGKDKHIPQEAIDELHQYFKEHDIDTRAYTLKELYGYFDFNMPYLAFKHLILNQNIQTNDIIIR
jgi:AraC-like DNA-binding protein